MTKPQRSRRAPTKAAMLLAVALLAAACASGTDDAASPSTTIGQEGVPPTTGPLGSGTSPIQPGLRIAVLSSQPDRVTGDDARVSVTPPPGTSAADVRLRLGDTDVTNSLTEVDGRLEGVVQGFIEGNNTLTATSGGEEIIQRIRAWPITGPVISGPHLPLLACSTDEAGLGAPTDENCSAPTKITWRYIDTAGELRDLPDVAAAPDDLASAEIDGRDVPLYVRYEQGVINRSVYEIASVDPTPGDDDPTGPGWNRKVLYRFGGGCGATYGQGRSLTTAAEPAYLTQGYAVATATFNTFAVQCNDVLSAETVMMVSERIVEAFGTPQFTIGEGASGGAIQLHLLAQNYPGLIEGAVALLPFPDALSIAPGVTDCGLLLDYYEGAGSTLGDEQRQAINGHGSPATCQTWARTFLSAIDPSTGCDPKIDAADIYDAETNRGGVRCTLQDANRNQLGFDEATGWARRPLDNLGVQYGLIALNEGDITFDQFVQLNEDIGGYDIDGVIVDERAEADPEAVLAAYESGRISMGGGDQANIPIIDIDVFTDATGDIHDRFRAFSLRARLNRRGAPDGAPGHQIWTRDPGDVTLIESLSDSVSGGLGGAEAVAVIDEWLTELERSDGSGTLDEALRRTRPDAAIDNCASLDGTNPIGGIGIYDEPGPCQEQYPLAGDPRIAAGAPLANDVLKCSLKPVDARDYEIELSAEQLRRLQAVFPQGVCNWLSAGEGQTVPVSPDRSYEDVQSPAQDA